MNIGMVCYASVGGSGVVATELARALAEREHQIHVISSEPPFRWRDGVPGLSFVKVEVPPYPLFREPQYLLALTNTIARVAEQQQLDLVHAHYAVPHATAAYLARQMLEISPGRTPRTVTTLHGTDITLVGSDPSYRRVVAFSIEQSDAVTTVSRSLRADTISALGVQREIEVIPNFLDCAEYRRRPDPSLRARLCPPDRYDALVIHVSNLRPVKRVDVAVEVFRRLRTRVRARFLIAGDGPVRGDVERQAAESGIGPDVAFLGEQDDLVALLSVSDLFLLPSIQESFGLAALEAMACGVPVVASGVGGLPEIIEDGVTGYTCRPDDVDGMADRGVQLLTDRALHARVADAAAMLVRETYCTDRVVPMYEAAYRHVLARAGTGSS
jgi:N-acetyl-alpha-D-glucosaminyl L-malate synthase BshA